jgi:hypothetical protein
MSFARSIGAAFGVVGVAGCGISGWRRMAWGATAQEASAAMPGDEIVGLPRYRTTHAITIDASVADVWPWLVQIGQGRGGLYSCDWLENLLGLDIHSAQDIDASLQTLSVGDVVRLVPEGTDWLAYKYVLQPIHFVMERKMLLGIKRRAEQRPGDVRQPAAVPA